MRAHSASGVDTKAGRNSVRICCDVADITIIAGRQYSRSVHLASVITVSDRISDQPAIRLKHNAVGAVLIGCHAADLDITDRPDAWTEHPLATDIAGYEALCSDPRTAVAGVPAAFDRDILQRVGEVIRGTGWAGVETVIPIGIGKDIPQAEIVGGSRNDDAARVVRVYQRFRDGGPEGKVVAGVIEPDAAGALRLKNRNVFESNGRILGKVDDVARDGLIRLVSVDPDVRDRNVSATAAMQHTVAAAREGEPADLR